MFRLLIVDDEPIIVEGLAELFQHLSHLELEVHQAYDGIEALEIAKELRMDIILSDIEMPEMNGIKLQKEVNRLWTRCKFIFLTGYNDFNYIQETTRGGAIDFVLKTEGDKPIIAAVEKAVHSLQEEVSYEQLISSARDQMNIVLPTLQKDYLTELLQREDGDGVNRRSRFQDLAIPLNGDMPVYVVLGRIDEWRADMKNNDRFLFIYSVNNIVEEYFSTSCRIFHMTGEQNRMIWFIQPIMNVESELSMTKKNTHTFLLGTMEAVQTACRQYLKLVCSFVVSSEPYEWEQLSIKFDRLSLLFERGLGLGNEMLLSDERIFNRTRENVRTPVRRIRLLDQYLTQRDRDRFFAHYTEMMEAVGEPEALHAGLSLEIFYDLTAIFISQLNRLELFSVVSDKLNISKLLSIREHNSWKEVTSFFVILANMVFECIGEETEQETNEVVHTIHAYVEANIGGDLTLNRLSGLVFLTPFYVSRLYKMKTGNSISDFITEARIERAKKLLSETHLKIHEVGNAIGYDSASYFTRFFKKITQLTPQEFRDSIKKI